jgi:ABC-type sugar transport system permease subunit
MILVLIAFFVPLSLNLSFYSRFTNNQNIRNSSHASFTAVELQLFLPVNNYSRLFDQILENLLQSLVLAAQKGTGS